MKIADAMPIFILKWVAAAYVQEDAHLVRLATAQIDLCEVR